MLVGEHWHLGVAETGNLITAQGAIYLVQRTRRKHKQFEIFNPPQKGGGSDICRNSKRDNEYLTLPFWTVGRGV